MTETRLTHVLAVACGSWGKGDSPMEALNNWKRHVSSSMLRDSVTVELRAVTSDATMDGLGYLQASKIEKLPSVTFTKKEIDLIWGGQEVLDEKCWPVQDRLDEMDEFRPEYMD